jgi:hypothetical protein
MVRLSELLCKPKLSHLARSVPITDLGTFPPELSVASRRELPNMETLDEFSPDHDKPQRITTVSNIVADRGCQVTFVGKVNYKYQRCTLVRAIRKP